LSSALQILPERAVLRVGGPEARSFLHGLLTADIASLTPGDAVYGALLSPQGKILFDMIVLAERDGFLIDCAASGQAELIKRLGFYKLRAKVEIAERPDLNVVVAEESIAGGFPDPRFEGLGFRALHSQAGAAAGSSDYHVRRIALGIPDSDGDIGSGELFPHEANLDQLHGVSFTKGCYVGQEVVSRMEHRGTARNRILPVTLEGPAPVKGAAITAGGRSIGTLLSSAGERALALLRLDRLAEAAQAAEPLLTEGVRLHVRRPPWAQFEVAGTQEARA
jgi:tRNA-modifying protein YgfZ